ncbi:hypothetical protein [Phaffia rhodozyma]|uniref:Uncharacterized protein n=1 Tax=Phaffia rhodozyma TaxID=264483 RepID=A0A0F7SSC0_PHARH|nr:hypothetical protein [Phaffia rhodozyma]
MNLPHPPPPTGFVSSFLTLTAIIVVLLASWAIVMFRSRRSLKVLDAERRTELTYLLDGVQYKKQKYEWDTWARGYLIFLTIVLFGINTFSIVSSILQEPYQHEPKFWLLKVVTIPTILFALIFQLVNREPHSYAPAQLNYTIVLLLTLVLVVITPLFTSIPADTDRGRLSLARRLMEHLVGPALLMGGLVAVHRVVHDVFEDAITRPPSLNTLDEESEDGFEPENEEETPEPRT